MSTSFRPDIGAAIQGGTPSPTEGMAGWVAPSTPNQGLEDPREAAIWTRLRLRHFTNSGCGVDQNVTTGATTVAITFKRAEPNTNYGISILVGWATTYYVAPADKAKTGFTVHFGTAPAGSAGKLSWATFRSEDS